MKKISFREKINYRIDEMMSRGSIAMISLLALISLVIIILAGILISILGLHSPGDEPMSILEAIWQSLMRALDSGTIGGDLGWSFRLVTFLVTLGGIFIVSTLIGVLSNGIESKLAELQKGKSLVLEDNFILILGWSSKIFTIIPELVIANENIKNPCIVILANKEKVEMEDEIRSKIGNLKNMKIVCRTGNPYYLEDLEISNLNNSKAILILSPEGDEQNDYMTIKTLLAITKNPNRRSEPFHIAVEIHDEKNSEILKLVGGNEVELILSDEIISRIMVQASRQSGLSIVYSDLMDFDGDEIYFYNDPNLLGKKFGDTLFLFDKSAVIGLMYSNGKVEINPSMDYEIQSRDQLILIAEDDSKIQLSSDLKLLISSHAIIDSNDVLKIPERLLILGWNNRGILILKELDKYLPPNSYVKVVSKFEIENDTISSIEESLANIKFEYLQADSTSKYIIEQCDIKTFDAIQILCYSQELDQQEADANTIVTLFHLRNIIDENDFEIKIVSEMLDVKNRDLAHVTKADDFIVSDKIISLLMAQIAENKHLTKVFDNLFDADGSEIYLKPITDYIDLNGKFNFYTPLESAKRKNQIAIGYRISKYAQDSKKNFGIVLNPSKSQKIDFSANDSLIVIAQD
ncbi:MAG: CASTOR/POLLUX-related putative ion channel [Crocinitomicaceae bacterium]|jgi:voltage-gated potassium channel Kch